MTAGNLLSSVPSNDTLIDALRGCRSADDVLRLERRLAELPEAQPLFDWVCTSGGATGVPRTGRPSAQSDASRTRRHLILRRQSPASALPMMQWTTAEIAPGSAVSGLLNPVLARTTARPEFCIPTSRLIVRQVGAALQGHGE